MNLSKDTNDTCAMCCTTEQKQTERKKEKPRSVFVGLWWWPHVKWNAEYRTVQCSGEPRYLSVRPCAMCVDQRFAHPYGSFKSEIYYSIAIAIRLMNRLCTHFCDYDSYCYSPHKKNCNPNCVKNPRCEWTIKPRLHVPSPSPSPCCERHL